jgi:2,3-dihydro-2,3-dihydroxybenzoate dehydrogenase
MGAPELEYGLSVVTGAASGIGAAVAAALVAAGGRVAAFDLDEAKLGGRAQALGTAFTPYVIDVTDEPAVETTIARVERDHGPIRGLVQAAGVLPAGELCSPSLTRDAFRRALAVNVEAVWLVARAAGRYMIRRREGAIVTVASNAGSTPRSGMGFYCASKAASVMLTRCLGLELARHGVRSNIVAPGSTDTPMLESLLNGAPSAGLVAGDPAGFRLGIPLGRIATPADVAEAVLFLLSERARHITMQELRVDGGATL